MKPQLADTGNPNTIRDAVMEPKIDGHRMMAHYSLDGVRLYTRTGRDVTANLPKITDAVTHLIALLSGRDARHDPIWLDGEAQHVDGWGMTQSILGSSDGRSDAGMIYHLFDIPSTTIPLADRRATLDDMFARRTLPQCLQLVPQVPYNADTIAKWIAAGGEGAIVKDPRSYYAPGKRGKGWIKVKAYADMDVVITGAVPGNGMYEGFIGALTFAGPDGITGQCSGMTHQMRMRLTRAWEIGTLEGRVMEIRHNGRMPSGGLRHPQFLRLRPDKVTH